MPTLDDPEFRQEIFKSEYPIVFISGVFGYSDVDYIAAFFNYWQSSQASETNPAPVHLRRIFIRGEKLGSPHHGAITTFFQLMGGIVDYGEEESTKHGHNRYGRGYPAQHPLWSKKNKVWIISHSNGTPMALDLQRKLEDKFFIRNTHYGTSINALTEDEMGPEMIAGIISVNGNFSGTWMPTIFFPPPIRGEDKLVPAPLTPFYLGYWIALLAILIYKYQPTVLRALFDLSLEPWEFEKYSLWDILTMNVPFITSGDSLIHTSYTKVMNELNRDYKLYDCSMYFSIATQMTYQDTLTRLTTVDPLQALTFPIFYPTAWYVLLFGEEHLVDGEVLDARWFHNDGVVPQLSQYGPRIDGDWSVPVRIFEQPEMPIYYPDQIRTLESGVMNAFAAPRDLFRNNHLTVGLSGVNLEAAKRAWSTAYSFVQGCVTRDSDFPQLTVIV